MLICMFVQCMHGTIRSTQLHTYIHTYYVATIYRTLQYHTVIDMNGTNVTTQCNMSYS